jgi:hypothetical protein
VTGWPGLSKVLGSSAPVRRPLRQEPVVVRPGQVAPPLVRVVDGLLRQHRQLLDVEVDSAVVVGDAARVIQNVHA